MDGDKLGYVGGALVATVVMGVSFYFDVSMLEGLFRAAFAFVVGYVVTFVLVRLIHGIAIYEEQRRAELEAAVEAQMEAEAAGQQGEGPASSAETGEA